MQANFEHLLPEILKREGGFVDHPRDPGGATNLGITIGTFRSHVKSDGTVADLKALTIDQAGIVYRAQYWEAIKGDDLPSGVDYAVFDFAVNSGPGRAAKYLQRVVGASQDGAIGPDTLDAVRRDDPEDIINDLCDARLAFMKRIRGGSLWKTFGRGWQRRVDEVRALSLDLVDAVAPRVDEDEVDLPDFIADPDPAPIHQPTQITSVADADIEALRDLVREADSDGSSTLIRAASTKLRSALTGGTSVGVGGYIIGSWDKFVALPFPTQALIVAGALAVLGVAYFEYRSSIKTEASRMSKGQKAKVGDMALQRLLARLA